MAYAAEQSGVLMPVTKQKVPLRGSSVEFPGSIRFGATGMRAEPQAKLGIPERYYQFRRIRRRVPVVGSFFHQLERSFQHIKFKFEEGENIRARELLGPLLTPQAVSAVSRNVLEGMSVVEWSLDENGNIGSWIRIPPETITQTIPDEHGSIIGFVQQTTEKRVQIPRWKTIYTTSGDSWRGEGLMLDIADMALEYLSNRDDIVAAQKDNLSRKPNIHASQEFVEGDGKNLLNKINNQNFPPGTRFVLPSEVYDTETIEGAVVLSPAAKQVTLDYPDELQIPNNDSRELNQRAMALTLGMEAYALAGQREGSRALGEVLQRSFDTIVIGSMLVAEQAYNELLEYLYDIRMFRGKPTLKIETESLPTPAQQVEILTKLQPGGMALDTPQAQELLKNILLPTEVKEPETLPVPTQRQQEEEENDGNGNV